MIPVRLNEPKVVVTLVHLRAAAQATLLGWACVKPAQNEVDVIIHELMGQQKLKNEGMYVVAGHCGGR